MFSLIMKPWFHNNVLVGLNRHKAAAEFHKMFKYLELLTIRGRIRTTVLVDATKTPSDIYQVRLQPACSCVFIRLEIKMA